MQLKSGLSVATHLQLRELYDFISVNVLQSFVVLLAVCRTRCKIFELEGSADRIVRNILRMKMKLLLWVDIALATMAEV